MLAGLQGEVRPPFPKGMLQWPGALRRRHRPQLGAQGLETSELRPREGSQLRSLCPELRRPVAAMRLPENAQALQDLGFNPPGAADEGSDRLLNETSTRVVDEVSTASSEPGSFLGEMPPIPFGLLPMTRPALPTRWQAPTNVKSGKLPDRPIADYDRSNCQCHESLCISIPPLVPCDSRLPGRRFCKASPRSSAEHIWVHEALLAASRSLASGEVVHAVVVWAAESSEVARSSGEGCRLPREGQPLVLLVNEESSASLLREEIMRCRAARLGF
mmetsp:Transcript_91830/g.165798  ORF Transcript_91830/g.165798 Transcript_91830/m.165798 type:complete len:274 (+) Transcript_91830:273-1094(+)